MAIWPEVLTYPHMLSTALYFFLLRNTYYLLHNRLINSPEIILWHYNKKTQLFLLGDHFLRGNKKR